MSSPWTRITLRSEAFPSRTLSPLHVLHEPPETLIRGMVPGTLFRFEVEIKDLAVGVLACSPTLCQVGPQALPRKVKQLDVFFRIEAQPLGIVFDLLRVRFVVVPLLLKNLNTTEIIKETRCRSARHPSASNANYD